MENLNNYIFIRYNSRVKWFLQILPKGAEIPPNSEIIDIFPIWNELLEANLPIKSICKKHRITYTFVNKIFHIAFQKI